MLQNNHSSWNWKRKILAITTVATMTTVVFGLGIFAPPAKLLTKMQELQNPTFQKLNFENAPEIPLIITEAEIKFTNGKNYSTSTSQERIVREVRIASANAKLTNSSSRPVKGYVLELRYPSEANQPPKLFQVIVEKSLISKAISGTMLPPQSSTIFSGSVPAVEETNANLSQFTLRVVGIMFDADQEWYWTEAGRTINREGMQIQSLSRMPNTNPSIPNSSQLTVMPETSPQKSAAPYSDEIPTATASTKPVITYKEKAEYTPEALTAEVEGTIAVNAIFGSDGNIYGARIIRGLPMGLNEEAMKAVQKIKFKPATKNGENVSVRMTMEFSFSGVKSGK